MALDTLEQRGHSGSAYWQYLLPVTVLLLVLWPLVPVTYPPLLDYYSHLARVHITSHIQDFSEFYAINKITPPNLAFDVLVGALGKVLPPEIAGWLFVVSVIGIQATGMWILNRKLHGRQGIPIMPLIGCALVYNAVLTMGFLSYLFGLGLMLWMIWLWLLVRERSWWITLSLVSAAAVLLYFAHIVVLALYAITVVGFEMQQVLQDQQKPVRERIYTLIKSGIPMLAPTLLYITRFRGDDPDLVQYSQPFLLGKLQVLVGTLNTGSSPVIVGVAGLAILAALLLALGRPRLSGKMVLPIALLTLLFIGAPSTIAGGRYIDDRLALPLALVVCASLRVDFATGRRAIVMVVAVVAFLAIRSFDLSRDFMRFDAEVKRARQVFSKIEPRSVVAIALDQTHPEYSWSARGRANWHVAALAALHAPVFVTTTHARASQHTMFVKGPPFTDLYAWQKELPIELSSDKQLAETIASYRELTRRRPGESIARPYYLLLLMPHTLTEAARLESIVIAQTRWFLLLRIDPKA